MERTNSGTPLRNIGTPLRRSQEDRSVATQLFQVPGKVPQHKSYWNMSQQDMEDLMGRLSGKHYAIIPLDLKKHEFLLMASSLVKQQAGVFSHKVGSDKFWIGDDSQIHFEKESQEHCVPTLKKVEAGLTKEGFSPLTKDYLSKTGILISQCLAPKQGRGWGKWIVALGVLGIAAGVIYIYREKLLPQKQVVGDSTDHLLATPDEMKIPEPVVEPSLTDRAQSLYNRLASSISGK